MAESGGHNESAHPFVELFSDYYDGELYGDELEAFEQELESNEALRTEYETFANSLDMLHNLEFSFAPDNFVQEVTRDINQRTRGKFFKQGWLFSFRIPYEVFAAVLLAVFGALYLFGLQAPSGYQVEDAPDEFRPTLDETPRGKALGNASKRVDVLVDARVDLGVVSRGLKNDGFSVRPEVDSEGRDALAIDVPTSQLERFAQRATPLIGKDLLSELETARDQGENGVEVWLVLQEP